MGARSWNFSRTKRGKSRLFNGNIRQPVEFIVVWAAILAFIVGIWIVCLNIGVHKRDYTRADLVFESARVDGYRVVLTLSGEEFHTHRSLCDVRKIKDLSGGEILSAITAKDEVVALSFDNKELQRLEDFERSQAEEKRGISIGMGLMMGMWLLYIAGSTIVMCNAHKMPRWLVIVFVKPSYLTFIPK